MRQFVAAGKGSKTVRVGTLTAKTGKEGFEQDCEACHKLIAISRDIQRRMAVFLGDHAGVSDFFLESEPLEKDNDMVSREFKVACGNCAAKHVLRVSYRAG